MQVYACLIIPRRGIAKNMARCIYTCIYVYIWCIIYIFSYIEPRACCCMNIYLSSYLHAVVNCRGCYFLQRCLQSKYLNNIVFSVNNIRHEWQNVTSLHRTYLWCVARYTRTIKSTEFVWLVPWNRLKFIHSVKRCVTDSAGIFVRMINVFEVCILAINIRD